MKIGDLHGTSAALCRVPDEHVLDVTTEFARSRTKSTSQWLVQQAAKNTLSPEFSDDKHGFWSRDSWQFGGY